MLLRALASTAILVTVYDLLPLNHSSRWLAIMMLVIGLVLLTGLVAVQVRWVATSRYPRLRAIEALATSVPLFLLVFASAYVVMATIAAGSFSQPMTHTNALSFTVTVFATVGFGDITAKTLPWGPVTVRRTGWPRTRTGLPTPLCGWKGQARRIHKARWPPTALRADAC